MIDDKTMATTAEILLLADFSKQRLSQLEQAGVVKRAAKDSWPLAATIKALFADARQRSQEYSEAKTRFETIKADREKLKLMKEAKEVVPASDIEALLALFRPLRLCSGQGALLRDRVMARSWLSGRRRPPCNRSLVGRDTGQDH
jgi:hypothetical protein